ncbi:LytTR family DNA-binding domain-containing protein [Lachnoclostridium sp.]|nr:LytTR family DNA-binding domain-containing protein [Lachnoclostridium sp.]
MTSVLILEDCKQNAEALGAIIKESKLGLHALFAYNYNEAINILKSEVKISLFLLDINLDSFEKENKQGLLFAKKIREIPSYAFTPIVFITSIAELELLSYRETQCYSYLVKPYEKNQVLGLLSKLAMKETPMKREQLTVKKAGVNYRIHIEDIICVEAIPRGVSLYLKEETLDVKYLTIKQLLEKLPSEQFLQCHRMFVVNTDYIDYVDTVNQMIRLNGIHKTIEIGITYKSNMRRWMNE